MTQTADKRRGYSLDDDLMPIMKGKMPLPNFEEMEAEKGIATIAAGGGLATVPDIMTARLSDGGPGHGGWARYFLSRTQAGVYDGAGYVMFWDRGKGRAGRFAICKHAHVEDAGANRQRGWHPGHCSKCGLDMTVDSGD